MSGTENEMYVDLIPLLNGKAAETEFSFNWTGVPDVINGIKPKEPITVSGKVTAKQGYMVLRLGLDFDYTAECARCLRELERSVSLTTEKNVDTADGQESDDSLVIENGRLGLTDACLELMFLELPSRELCREDCKGLCSRCGADLNEGPCSCEKEIDPRMEVFRRYLTKENEDQNH